MNDSSKVFDRVTVMAAATGVLVIAAVLVLVVRGPSADGAGSEGTEALVQLREFAVIGDLAVSEGPVEAE